MSKGRRDEPEINKFSFPLLFQLVHDGVVRPGVDEVVADLVHDLHHDLQRGGGGAAWWGDRREGAGERGQLPRAYSVSVCAIIICWNVLRHRAPIHRLAWSSLAPLLL